MTLQFRHEQREARLCHSRSGSSLASSTQGRKSSG
jgi:hypothetical protein